MAFLQKKYQRWLTVLFLLYLLVTAFRFGIAELYSLNARRMMNEWETRVQPPAYAQVESVASQLDIASQLAGGNPAHHENIARLSLLQVSMPEVQPDEVKKQLQLGLAEIRTAISLRPASPYSWTLLLMIKRELGEYDAEFRHALHRATELGPWEPELLVTLADVGLSAWPKMPATEQALIQQVFVRGLTRQNQLVRDVADRHRNECAADAATGRLMTECQ